MSETEVSSLSKSTESHLLEPIPLRRGQRLGASVIGMVLTGAGLASVFLSENQIGSGVLLHTGAAFLLIAVSGMPILGAKFQDFEVRMAWHWRRSAAALASRLPSDEARRLFSIIDASAPAAYPDSMLTLIDSLLFEARVRDAVIAALKDGERIEVHPEADIGEPLAELISERDDVRIGVYAMFAPTENGTLAEDFTTRFVRQVPRSGCDALIMITCVPDKEDLAKLAARIEKETGTPVAVEQWEPAGTARPLRVAIEHLAAATKATSPDG
ncbi:hypothetical protein [Sphaerisporangium dianthi]|uniref:PrgI family protein n=1 Tax=Sphaerisporangium dianthi TaxID=1436120 RepID=A0ABV9C8J1_9ACTN